MTDELVILGRITRPHGVRGEVRVFPHTQTPDSFLGFRSLLLRRPDCDPREVRVLEAKVHGSMVLLRLEGVGDRSGAEELIGADLLIGRDMLPELDEGEYYWADLIGLEVFDERGTRLGRVAGLLAVGADDLLRLENGEREIFLPFREEVITEVDLAAGRMSARPPEGLLELEDVPTK